MNIYVLAYNEAQFKYHVRELLEGFKHPNKELYRKFKLVRDTYQLHGRGIQTIYTCGQWRLSPLDKYGYMLAYFNCLEITLKPLAELTELEATLL